MALIARWTFAGMGGLWDETENWQKAELLDNARLTHRGLELPKSGGWARVRPAPGVEINLTKKTLISWVILDDLTDKKPGGSALTLDAIQEDNFDGIVFGELADVAWMAGSTNYTRTATPNNENPAEKESGKLLKLAVSYGATPDGKAEIKIYRNDKLSRTYQQGVLATHSANDLEALFGARLTIGNKPIGHLIATIVAAEIHDQTLSDQEIAARQLDDPATFVRRTVSLRSVNNPENFIGVYEKTGVELFPATPPDPTNTKERVTWVLIPGLADPTLVSLQIYKPAGAYLVTVGPEKQLQVQYPDGTNDFRTRATFKQVPGLAGSGWSFESLSYPGHFLRDVQYAIHLDPEKDATSSFQKDATFTFAEGWVPDFTTELSLDDQSWYLISNAKMPSSHVLALQDNGGVAPVELPSTGSIDHALWRLERLPQDAYDSFAGFHWWKLINKKAGENKRLDTNHGKNGVYMADAVNDSGQAWTIRPVPWMGSDYFTLTNNYIEPDGSALDYDTSPRVARQNLRESGQLWRFTLMSYRDGVEHPTAPARIASIFYQTPHDEYVKTYPKYAGAFGMDYVATASVSDWALATARTVLSNVLLTLKDRSEIDRFEHYRILIVGDGDGVEADQYPDIIHRNPEFQKYRGGTDHLVARITEEMMCRMGITHIPSDKVYRKYDQVVHEFGHTIHKRLHIEDEIKALQGGTFDGCGFAVMIQNMFDCDMEYGSTRENFLAKEPKKFVDYVRKLFLVNREWRPYEVKYKHSSPASAKLSAEDEAATFDQYDEGAAENPTGVDAAQPAKPDNK